MLNDYSDIRDLVNKEPDWWDENGVPRWGDHDPRKSPDIYCNEAALILIQCQGCKRQFHVQATGNSTLNYFEVLNHWYYRRASGSPEEPQPEMDKHPLATSITDKSYHYGDPPNVDCCGAGATMNCEDIRVIEYWRTVNFVWTRMPEFEIELEGEYDAPTD